MVTVIRALAILPWQVVATTGVVVVGLAVVVAIVMRARRRVWLFGILAVAVVTIVGSMATAISLSTRQRQQASANAYLNQAAENIQAATYATCKGHLIAVGHIEKGELRPTRVFNFGEGH